MEQLLSVIWNHGGAYQQLVLTNAGLRVLQGLNSSALPQATPSRHLSGSSKCLGGFRSGSFEGTAMMVSFDSCVGK